MNEILSWYGVPSGKGEQLTLMFETQAPPATLRPATEVIHIVPKLNRAQRRAGVGWDIKREKATRSVLLEISKRTRE